MFPLLMEKSHFPFHEEPGDPNGVGPSGEKDTDLMRQERGTEEQSRAHCSLVTPVLLEDKSQSLGKAGSVAFTLKMRKLRPRKVHTCPG